MEDKIIDQIISILVLMNSYVPTPAAPANPNLPVILAQMKILQIYRNASKQKFKMNFINISEIAKEISTIKF